MSDGAAAGRAPPTQAPRMGALARLPIFLALAGKRVVVAGDGAAAAWKAELLSAAGAEVHVFASHPGEEISAVAAQAPRGAMVLHARAWQPGDFAGAALAVGGFDDDGEARRFASAARAAGVPVNVIDKPDHCDFSFGAIVNRSPLVIGISTDGAAPAFGQAIRAKLEGMIPRGFAHWADAARRWRAAVQASGLSFAARRRFWQAFTSHAVTHADCEPVSSDFDRFIDRIRDEGAAADAGSVMLVGAGPGDPELLTLRAVRALASADVILMDDLVSPEVVDFARREARKMLLGDAGGETIALMVKLAKAGRRLVHLVSGDPMTDRATHAQIAACRAAGISIEVIAGVSSPGTPPAACSGWPGAQRERRAQAPQPAGRG
jgi:uroporphyrin-III C-methyltransferase / precorrin-2 dehydrogenase / sirohydrochlorin ferrochelatase